MKRNSGFSIIELLFSIAIMAIILGIVILIALPKDQRSTAQNLQRRQDVETIANAITQYTKDNKGNLPTSITKKQTEICKTSSTNCAELINLSVLTLNEKYLVSIPNDPLDESVNGAGYAVYKTDLGKIVVVALYLKNISFTE